MNTRWIKARLARLACVVVSTVLAVSVAVGECDTVKPTLTTFDFNPKTVNVTSAAQTVTCSMTVADALAGVDHAACTFRAPGFLQNYSCNAAAPSSGTRNNGVFSCNVTIPRFAESGIYKAQLTIADAVGNTTPINDFDLLLRGLPTDLTVTSTSDVVAPTLTTFDFNPKSVTVSAGPQTVECTMVVADALSGVDRATCFFTAPDSSQGQACVATAPSSGTRNNGTFKCSITMPRYADNGTWQAQVSLSDAVNNSAFFDPPTLQGRGFPINLAVTSNPEDIQPPSLTTFDFTPKTIDTSSAAVNVTCTITVADSPAGVANAGCDFTSPSLQQSQSCTATTPSSGTRNSGTFTCVVTLPRYAEGGVWKAGVNINDQVNNSLDLAPADLAGRGLPTDLTNNCSSGEAEPVIRFQTGSKTTIVWNPITGATSYNVYRGNLTGMVDANHDNQPDGGYGTCQNSRDPVLTDTQFVDTDTPNQTTKGFHYLVSYKSSSGEKGLGKRSNGTARTVTPCP